MIEIREEKRYLAREGSGAKGVIMGLGRVFGVGKGVF